MTFVRLNEAKRKLPAIVEQVATTHEVVTITRRGRPAAVLMAPEHLESLRETLFWISELGVRDDIAEAERETETGQAIDADELRGELGLTQQIEPLR